MTHEEAEQFSFSILDAITYASCEGIKPAQIELGEVKMKEFREYALAVSVLSGFEPNLGLFYNSTTFLGLPVVRSETPGIAIS